MDKIIQELANTNPREIAGSTTSSRYDFQKDWGISLLLEKYNAINDYTIIFDYHEDTICIEKVADTSTVSFFQIKAKKQGNWSISSLTKKTPKKSSILKKLANNLSLSTSNKKLYFISNAYFKVNLKDKLSSLNKNIINLSELDDKDKNIIIEKLKQQECYNYNEIIDSTCLSRTCIPHENSDIYIKGLINEFLEENEIKISCDISTFYKTLFDEVKRKTRYSYIINNPNEIKKKSISKHDFKNIIQTIMKNDTKLDEIFEKRVVPRLNTEKINYKEILKLREAFNTIKIKMKDENNTILSELLTEISLYIKEEELDNELFISGNNFVKNLTKKDSKYLIFSESEIIAIFMVKINE